MANDDAEDARAESEARGGIQSLDAALRVLQAMAAMPSAVTLSDLARSCGMPASKVHRYLASFLHAGLVRQHGRSGAYDLGPAAIDLGLAALTRHDFVNRVADELPALTAETNLTALLCVWGNAGATVVRWERSADFVVTALGLGSTLPLLRSATGRVFLAFLPERLTRARIEDELSRFDPDLPGNQDIAPNIDGARDIARRVREAGYASVDGRFIPGLAAAAAPILDWQGQAQAVVALYGTDPQAVRPQARAIVSLLGFCDRHSIQRPARSDEPPAVATRKNARG